MESLKGSEGQFSGDISHPLRFGEGVETRRWFILLTVCLVYISSAIGFLTFNATSDVSMKYFHTDDENKILYFTDVNMYCNLFLSFFGCWVAYKYFRVSVIATAFLTSLAAWVRVWAKSNYLLALLCQTVIGLASITIFGFANIIPDRWFPTHERFMVNTLSVFSNYVGWALGVLIPCIIANNEFKMDDNLQFQAYIITIPFILAVICVKDKPKVPPSYSALVKNSDKGFIAEMRTLLKSSRFIGGTLCFGMVLGLANSIPTTNSIYMNPLELSNLTQGYVTLGYVVAGLVSGLAGTVYIEKKGIKNCDFMLKILLSITFLALVVLGFVFVALAQPDFYLILACNCVLGIGMVGFMPFACASIIESNFPIQEAISTNGMNMAASILSIGASHLSIAGFVGKGGFLVLAGLMLPCWVYMMFFYQTSYKKQEADDSHQQMGASSGMFNDEVKTVSVSDRDSETPYVKSA